MIGLAARSGTAVLPMCSMALKRPGSAALSSAMAASALAGQVGSYGSISMRSLSTVVSVAPMGGGISTPDGVNACAVALR